MQGSFRRYRLGPPDPADLMLIDDRIFTANPAARGDAGRPLDLRHRRRTLAPGPQATRVTLDAAALVRLVKLSSWIKLRK